LYNYAHRVKRTAFEVFSDFDSAKEFPLEYLLDMLPEIRSRSFSISSCAEVSKPFLKL
jgi:sulfite reductase alpha subunit-like flavoprotein